MIVRLASKRLLPYAMARAQCARKSRAAILLLGSRSLATCVGKLDESAPRCSVDPQLALAYDYIDHDDECYDASMNNNVTTTTATTTIKPPPPPPGSRGGSSPYPPPPPPGTTFTTIPRKTDGGGGGGGGGGGSGRHRCPKVRSSRCIFLKCLDYSYISRLLLMILSTFSVLLTNTLCVASLQCGTFVTFRHGDFDENTFYCAACSGWFVISPHTTVNASTGGKNFDDDEILEKRVKQQDPPVLMQHIPDDAKIYSSQRPVMGGSSDDLSREQQPVREVRQMPTPREIMRGLNEYVIGQRNVKVALSVGVYNHYKRIFVAESQAAAQRRAEEDAYAAAVDTAPTLSDLNLAQVGTTTTTTSTNADNTSAFCEAPDIENVNNINDASTGRDVEDVEIDKSNIMLLGPTGTNRAGTPFSALLAKKFSCSVYSSAHILCFFLTSFLPFFKVPVKRSWSKRSLASLTFHWSLPTPPA